MEFVGPAFEDLVELSARRMPELGGKLVLQDSELRYRIVRHGHERSSRAFIVVVDTFDCEIVVGGPLATHRRAESKAQSATRRHTSSQQRQIEDSGPYRRDGKLSQL